MLKDRDLAKFKLFITITLRLEDNNFHSISKNEDGLLNGVGRDSFCCSRTEIFAIKVFLLEIT